MEFRRVLFRSCSVISSQCVVEIIDRPYMVARPVAWNGGKSCVNPATQRLVEIGLPRNAFPLPDCELRENGIFDAVAPLHAQNARIQQLLASLNKDNGRCVLEQPDEIVRLMTIASANDGT